MSEHNPSKQDMDFLAELDAQFGKQAKKKKVATDVDIRKQLNSLFHINNPLVETANGKVPESELQYNWQDAKNGLPQPITPEARVSVIVHQKCATCEETSWFTGNEYVRFFRRRLTYNSLGRGEVQTASTIMRRLSDCDASLVAFGLPTGHPLPQVIQEVHETVPRCPACIILERHCTDLWLDDVERKERQAELPLAEEPAATLVIPGLEGV